MEVIIDSDAGFCFGVRNAIEIAEKQLKTCDNALFCLGEIVHNEQQNNILKNKGMQIIEYANLKKMQNKKILIRAHGEPPATYKLLEKQGAIVIDATCPIVKKLQERIRTQYLENKNLQIVIYGKQNHAEVIGLLGNTNNTGIVVHELEDLQKIDFTKPVSIFSQTTMDEEGYLQIIEAIKEKKNQAGKTQLIVNKSVCGQVSKRIPSLKEFAKAFDTVIFVAGANSSNGAYLYNICKDVNPHSYKISCLQDIDKQWLANSKKIGVSGATSTPLWQMQEVSDFIKSM